jgi:hypothetical protein
VNRSAIGWPAVITVVLALALGVFAMNPLPIGIVRDDARYLLLARSIAEGTGYRFMLLPGSPAGTHFPPAFPLVLAAVWKVAPAFPANVTLFKALNALMLGLAATSVFAFARDRAKLASWAATGVALAFAGSAPVLFLDGVLFSEPFFIAAMCGALIVSERSIRPRESAAADKPPIAHIAFAAGLAIGGVTMIRTLGIAVGAGIAVTLIIRRQGRELASSMAGIALVVVPWQLWTMRHEGEIPPILSGDYGTYLSWLGTALHTEGAGFFARVFAANLTGFSAVLILFGVSGTMAAIVAVPLLLALAVGTVRLARSAPVSVVSIAAYLLVVLFWPFTPDRFLWPAWPFLLVGVARGAAEIAKWSPSSAQRRLARNSTLAALAGCALLFVRYNVGTYGSRTWEGYARDNAKLAIAESETAAQLPDGLVASEFDALVSLYTGRQAIPLLPLMAANYLRKRTPREAADQLSDMLDAYHPRFLLVGTGEALDAARLLAHASVPRIRFGGISPAGILLYVPTSP